MPRADARRVSDTYSRANRESALLILSDADRHGGLDSLPAIWARAVLRAAGWMAPPPRVTGQASLFDEGGAQ